MITRLSF